MVARCSKCDFRNLGIIWDRNRWSENFSSDFFSSKKKQKHAMLRKKSGKNGRPKFRSKMFSIDFLVEKIILIFDHKKSIEKMFDQNFCRPKLFFFSQHFCFDFFRRKNFRRKISGSHISIPNDPKIPKITLRTACDHYKNTNNVYGTWVAFFCTISPFDYPIGDEVGKPSVHHSYNILVD